jgi:hypothetical protein
LGCRRARRVTWHQGRAHSVSYNTAPGDGKDSDWSVKLLVTRDGIEYQQITVLDILGRPRLELLSEPPEQIVEVSLKEPEELPGRGLPAGRYLDGRVRVQARE